MSLVYIEDVVAAYSQLMRRSQSGAELHDVLRVGSRHLQPAPGRTDFCAVTGCTLQITWVEVLIESEN
jgi:hypothetical protein